MRQDYFQLKVNGYVYDIFVQDYTFWVAGASFLAERFLDDLLPDIVVILTNKDPSKDIRV